MATRRSHPDLASSWGVLDYEEDSGRSSDNYSLDEDSLQPLPPGPPQAPRRTSYSRRHLQQSIESSKPARKPASPMTARKKKDLSHNWEEETNSSHASSPVIRRVTRSSSSQPSVEPQFVMPTTESFTPSPKKRSRYVDEPENTSPISRQRRKSTKKMAVEDRSNQSGGDYLQMMWGNLLKPVLGYVFGLFGDVLHLLRQPLAAAVALLIIFLVLRALWQQSFGSLINPLSFLPSLTAPLFSPCSIPLVSLLMPWCGSNNSDSNNHAEFKNLVEVQDTFGRMLDIAQAGQPLPLQISMSEVAIIDLKDQISYASNLPSKNQLVLEMENFVQLARASSNDLGTFNVRIGGAVDSIVHMNRHTLRVLNVFNERAAASGMLGRLMEAILPAGTVAKRIVTEKDVIKQYLTHADAIQAQIDSLIAKGTDLKGLLDGMDLQLDTIREITNRDKTTVNNDREELLGQLWSKIGGNVKSKEKLEKDIALVKDLTRTRQAATMIVKMTLDDLNRINGNIKDMKARVQMPSTNLEMDALELESHIHYIQDGLDRLYNKRQEYKRMDDQRRQKLNEEASFLFGDIVKAKADLVQ